MSPGANSEQNGAAVAGETLAQQIRALVAAAVPGRARRRLVDDCPYATGGPGAAPNPYGSGGRR